MKLTIGKRYKLKFIINRTTLTYSAEVLEISNGFISFKDKFNQVLNYNLNNLVSYEDIKNEN